MLSRMCARPILATKWRTWERVSSASKRLALSGISAVGTLEKGESDLPKVKRGHPKATQGTDSEEPSSPSFLRWRLHIRNPVLKDLEFPSVLAGA